MNSESKRTEILINIFRHWFIILLTAIVFAGCSYFYTSFCVTKMYPSRGSLYVDSTKERSAKDVDYTTLITSKELIYTYIEVLQSDHYMNIVAEKSGLDYTGRQIKNMVSMSSLNETEIMEISVITENPEVSRKLIQTILDNADEEMTRVLKGGSVQIVDNASKTNVPSSPNVKRNTLLGFLLGFILCIAVVYYQDIFDTRIKSEFDCQGFNLPILGEIPGMETKTEKQ